MMSITLGQRRIHPYTVLLWLFCSAVLIFLMAPILAIMPLSFNSEPFFTYPMPGLSLQWYRDFWLPGVDAGAEEQYHRRNLRHDPGYRARNPGGIGPDSA